MRLRLQGQEVDREALGAENGWPAIPRPITQQEWEKSCEQVLRANEELADLVATLSDHDLARPYAEGRALRSQLVHGVISHNRLRLQLTVSIRCTPSCLWLVAGRFSVAPSVIATTTSRPITCRFRWASPSQTHGGRSGPSVDQHSLSGSDVTRACHSLT